MFQIEMLPADHGDCLWVQYGAPDAPRRVLIDGGTAGTWKRLRKRILLEQAKSKVKQLHFELFVVTHVDADHIGGAINLLKECAHLGVTFGDVWFNGWYHLDDQPPPPLKDELGPLQGEELSTLIRSYPLAWNRAFAGRAVMVPKAGDLPVVDLHGLKLTLLSPTFAKLQALKEVWQEKLAEAGLRTGDAYVATDVDEDGDELGDDVNAIAGKAFKHDTTEANGSSIAFLAEYDGKAVLFGADAHAEVLLESLERGANDDVSLPLAAFKVSHHGSQRNTNEALVKALPARRYLISTNGSQFEHPDPEAIARIAVHGPKGKQLAFNYRTEFNQEWDSATRKADFHYQTAYGDDVAGLTIEL
ncbi:MAG: hypothetical protein JWN04_6492 [Myxococcaceae bacterium]|nr:hypothetical protein [Myxococcaceae bacterium]